MNWAKKLLLCKDGRFLKDRRFPFCALDCCTRDRIQSQGGWFVNNVYKDAPKSLEQLKCDISEGENSHTDKLSDFSHNVKGLNGCWRAKQRAELC